MAHLLAQRVRRLLGSAAIGAISVARSDSNVIYAAPVRRKSPRRVVRRRVYKSATAGRTWSQSDYATASISDASAFIRRIRTSLTSRTWRYLRPTRSVACSARADGGKPGRKCCIATPHWRDRTLARHQYPRILFASFWQVRRLLEISSGGPGSACSIDDGGDTWEEFRAAPACLMACSAKWRHGIGRPHGRVWR